MMLCTQQFICVAASALQGALNGLGSTPQLHSKYQKATEPWRSEEGLAGR